MMTVHDALLSPCYRLVIALLSPCYRLVIAGTLKDGTRGVGETMDFRQINASDVSWLRTPRGAGACLPGCDKLTVQTPVVACTVGQMLSRYSHGWALTLTLPDDDPVCRAFGEFIDAIQASATRWVAESQPSFGAPADSLSSGLGARQLRVTAFSDTLFFDAAQCADPSGWTACACVLQLQGLWTSPTRWGLRWKVVQAKQASDAAAAAVTVPYAFDD